MQITRKIANRIAQTKFASQAIKDRADLGALKEKPTARIFVGVFLMCCSYILGLPAVGFIGALSVSRQEPLIIIIGGPILFIIAHLVFLAGMVLAGGRYIRVFFRWATRIVLEKLI
ncbi:MAG: hypothetical protein PVI38_05605 [Desulfobacterales bacterium]|jgi:hypothetical protein